MNNLELKGLIEAAWLNDSLLEDDDTKEAVRLSILKLDVGKIRVAEPVGNGNWQVNEWVKKAVLLSFRTQKMQTTSVGPFEFYDKMSLKNNYEQLGVRVVPHAIARFGAFLAKGVILMPSYVNIGAYVDEGTMVDTWATVGSCAQIGKRVHLSGGVGIGGVLEPVQNSPVIIEDGCFIGSRAVIVEGMVVKKGCVIAAGVTLTSSTKIYDVTGVHGKQAILHQGIIPENSVVISGTTPKKFAVPGDFSVPCALIVKRRDAKTDEKTSLNESLRFLKEEGIAV